MQIGSRTRTIINCRNKGNLSLLLFSLGPFYQSIGFSRNSCLTPVKVKYVGTRVWPLFAILGSFRVVTKSYNCYPETTNDLLNHILYSVENNALSNKEIRVEIERLCKSASVSTIANLRNLLHSRHIFLDYEAYNILLAAASERNDLELSLDIFKDILVSSKGMSSKSYFHLAKAFVNSDDHSKLLNFVREIYQLSHCGVLVLNRMIFAFGECRQIEKALMIFDHMKVIECEPDLVTYNTVLGLLGRAGRVDDMLQEFDSMKNAKISPDIVTYNTLLNNLQKMGRLDLCLVYMREMNENQLTPDLRTYTALIESFGRSGNVEEALGLFSAMKNEQVRPSIYIYRSLINNLKKMGKLEAASLLVNEMNNSLPNLVGPKDFKRKNR
ncbi:pentatricopeptide repeat-containing protein At1g11900 [Amaranthus tricolor]|uniref:pentatricopeptide repeat-containing protein At1g11900 n=1 Tax=Amaranthus tricolor TaxID=29722 RepID=UPI00258C0DED|nr:pentatricopeptide repeat-containing protein At1g11900 [Amaranthus tricolor]